MFEYDIIKGDQISKDDLKLERSRNIFRAIKNNSFTSILELRRNLNGDDIFVFETEVEIPQKPIHDIKARELIAIIVCVDDNCIPEVYALREDFPDLSHQNLCLFYKPKSLCLYEEPFTELQLTWTASKFIEKIRDWLRFSAKGKLHADDQPLEPLLGFNNSFLVLPHNFYSQHGDILTTVKTIQSQNSKVYVTLPFIEKIAPQENVNFLLTKFITNPFEHGIISKIPESIFELHSFLEKTGFNLISELRSRLIAWSEVQENIKHFDKYLIFIIILPKKRGKYSATESHEIRAFKTKQSIKVIGEALGCWDITENRIGRLIKVDESKHGSEIAIDILNTIESFTQENARLMNEWQNNDVKISAIGLGSLGSQIFNTLIRQGIGHWCLIDNDIILPHNLGRHILSQEHIGKHKAKVLSDFANNLFDDWTFCKCFLNDILKCSHESNPDVFESLESSNVIFDFSASVPVARFLCNDTNSDARRISCFFTSSGKDSVLIAEDVSRKNKLDMLEMVYYRAIINNSNLNDHLFNDPNKIRYGYSCRDISSKIPFDLTAQHAAFCSTEIKGIIEDNNPRISVWRTSQDNMVEKIIIPTTCEFRIQYGDWTLVSDKSFMGKIYNLRSKKLPKETGGILIGSHDVQRKIVYVVETIPSPPDSEEWPTSYIRGFKGLRSEVERLNKQSDGMLNYIGEWHSHPKGCTPTPSTDDLIAFKWLVEVLDKEDRPALMLIAGDTHEFFLGEMKIEKC